MSIEVRVVRKFSGCVVRDELQCIARKTLCAEGASTRQNLTIVIVDDNTIRDLNRRFHRVNTPTDVLAFPSDEPSYLGDIIISYETARANARSACWRIRDELALLAVHGILHLLGYDDVQPRARARMWQRQKEILGKQFIKGA